MKKMLLTSTGLQYDAVAQRFISMIPKATCELRILFIPTASRSIDELKMVQKSLVELLNTGVKKDNIFWFEPDVPATHRDNTEVDCIYVCGGNTYYLLKKLKECGMYEKIQKWVENGLLYIGASAGSVISAPDIDYIQCMDTNDCNLIDTSGLSLIPELLIPHYCDEFTEDVNKLRVDHPNLYAITDYQAIAVCDDKYELVSDY